jgi:alanyl-tRNA synthetase
LNKFDELKNSTESKVISGEDAFLLYDSFGFPLDLTELMARENGFTVDIAGFDKNMKEQKERSRSARKVISQEVDSSNIKFTSEFLGYSELEVESNKIEGNNIICQNDKHDLYGINQMFSKCRKCGQVICDG